jgi:di/tricarboxylate transporter
MGRIALLMPIVMALAQRAGLAEGSRGRIGLALAVGFGTFELSASILPSNVPNLVMSGAAEAAFGVHLTYLSYLATHAPVLGILKGVALTACICFLFPAQPRFSGAVEALGPLSRPERSLGLLLLVTLGFWTTDALHGISPAWVGLSAACYCLLPRVGFLSGDEFASGVNFRTCIYIAGILGLAALVTKSGLGNHLGDALLSAMPLDPAKPALDFGSLLGITALLNFVVTANGVPALFTPLAQRLAEGTGLPLLAVLMTQVVGYATPLLPYQASPIVVAMGMGGVRARDGVVLCLALAAVTYALLAPLDYLWFRFLGLL